VEENKKALALGGHGVGGEEDRDADVEDADVEEDEADGDDEMMDDEFGEEEEEEEPRMTKRRSRAAEAGGDDDDDDDDAPAGGGDDSVDFGISRKDAETRRRELFGKEGHLARSLVAACATNASAMLRSPEACDVLFETCSGGAGGVVVDGVGVEQLAELHDAVAEAARASVAGEEEEEEEEEEGEGGGGGDEKPRLPLHEDYFSTRTLRRMVLEIPGTASAGGSGAAAAAAGTGTPPPVFATSLWESAVSRDPNAWIDGHGAKVVAALARQVADDAVAAEAKKAIGARVKNKTPEEWIAGFFKRFDKSKSSKGEGEGGAKKKAAEKKAAEKPATEKKKDGGGGLAPVKGGGGETASHTTPFAW
jgi:pumilio family protein 6